MSDLVVFASDGKGDRPHLAATLFNAAVDPAKAYAVAAGRMPSGRIDPAVVDALREVGLDPTRVAPQMLTPSTTAGARWLVTIGHGVQCPRIPGARRLEWAVDDLVDASIERVRRIRDEVAGLVWAFVLNECWEP